MRRFEIVKNIIPSFKLTGLKKQWKINSGIYYYYLYTYNKVHYY